MFCTCDVKQLKMYFFKNLTEESKTLLKGPLVECSLHEMWSSSKSIFKNLSEESKTLFGGMDSRMYCTHFPWSRDTGQAFKNYKSRWSLLTVQSCFNSHRGNTSKFLLKRVDHFFGCSIQKVLYMRCEAAQNQFKKYFFKILLKRVDHFFWVQLPEGSLHEMWNSSKAAQKVFFLNLTEESKPLFEGTASRSFSNKQVTY